MPAGVKQFIEVYKNLPLRKKISFILLFLFGIGSIVLFFIKINTINYGVLYTKLTPEDAGAVINQLRSQNVSYKIGDGGETILVPKNILYETRLNLASEGLPQGGGQRIRIV